MLKYLKVIYNFYKKYNLLSKMYTKVNIKIIQNLLKNLNLIQLKKFSTIRLFLEKIKLTYLYLKVKWISFFKREGYITI